MKPEFYLLGYFQFKQNFKVLFLLYLMLHSTVSHSVYSSGIIMHMEAYLDVFNILTEQVCRLLITNVNTTRQKNHAHVTHWQGFRYFMNHNFNSKYLRKSRRSRKKKIQSSKMRLGGFRCCLSWLCNLSYYHNLLQNNTFTLHHKFWDDPQKIHSFITHANNCHSKN